MKLPQETISKIVGIYEFLALGTCSLFVVANTVLGTLVSVSNEKTGKDAEIVTVVPRADWPWQKEPRGQLLEVRLVGFRQSWGFANIWTCISLICCRGSRFGPRIWWNDCEGARGAGLDHCTHISYRASVRVQSLWHQILPLLLHFWWKLSNERMEVDSLVSDICIS